MKHYSLFDLSRGLCLFCLIYKFSKENLHQKLPIRVKMFLIYIYGLIAQVVRAHA